MKKWVGWLIYNRQDTETNRHYIRWMLEEATVLGLNLRLVCRDEIYAGIRGGLPSVWLEDGLSSAPDFVIVRLVDPTLNEQFEALGIATFNSAHVSRICNNKALTHQYLSQSTIPMLDTLFSSTEYLAAAVAPVYSFPFVLKTVSGRGGKEVQLVEDKAQLDDFVSRYPRTDVIIQALGPVPGKDVRVFVVGRQIVAAVLRVSNSSDFRANFSLGGKAELYRLTEMQEALIRRIISHFDFGMVGIDFLLDENGGLIFNEIEDVVGSRSLYEVAPELNIVRMYLTYIVNELSSHG